MESRGNPQNIGVLIVDDQDLVRIGLRTLLEHAGGFAVAGEAADGLGAVESAIRLRPDVVLMDIRMPGIDGLEATRRIVSDGRLADTKVIVLTTFERDEYVFEALRAGASGFLLKNTPPPVLLDGIRTVVDGGALLSPTVTRTVIAEFTSRSPRPLDPHPHIDQLTNREHEVVSLVAQGLSNEEIGKRLYVSPATARTHVSHAMLKLSARDRAQLVVFAFQSGLA
ncbi:two component transcriptional regulator, LuxR family [Beutenbergia cavernae DSM 12333]|uniref:Two component transcriptional regulator, LuxR family n=1 Tax=Beutenbergia cavernae (strain ATCC BAA-8 / DSM 12333 / CCUG 43141 / JCM 11478 / NBRC 16432 / NCIMB 13614 / HKI 0122) TaxID=471853 RepID=C5C474_BEUC1|nr:response regulator transcription factor [Beutenbergia cavernae]ACQ79987.1 two component transcriptional regulator, LuxR family [Beutenbergia cavernae DSM 12333]